MGEQLRDHYFLAVRIGLLLVLELYIVLSQSVLTGASARVLLLLALFVGVIAGKELVDRRKRILFFGRGGGSVFPYHIASRESLFVAGNFFVL